MPTLRSTGRFVSLIVLGLALPGLLAPAPAAAQTAMTRRATSSGAVDVAGGSFRLRGTVGEAGVVGQVDHTRRTLGMGFWPGHHVVTHVVDVPGDPDAPASADVRFANFLHAGTPNPFRGTTRLRYSVARTAPVRLEIFDVRGRRVVTLVDRSQEPGAYERAWDGRDGTGVRAGNGVYFYRLSIGGWSGTRKIQKVD